MFRTKSERAEQFNKRMHKEGSQQTKEQKDEIRKRNQYHRDNNDEKNKGKFRRAFPNDNHVRHSSRLTTVVTVGIAV